MHTQEDIDKYPLLRLYQERAELEASRPEGDNMQRLEWRVEYDRLNREISERERNGERNDLPIDPDTGEEKNPDRKVSGLSLEGEVGLKGSSG